MATGPEARIVLTAKDETSGAFASAQRNMQQLGSAAEGLVSRVGGLGAAFGVLGGAIAGAVSVNSLRGAIDTLDQLDDLSEKSGIAAESLSALRYAGEVVGTPMEALGTGVKKLAQNMALAAGGAKEQGAVFEALGVKLKNMDGSLRGSDKVLADIATKFKSFRDGPEKAALAMQVFGKAGTDMIPVLNQGADGLERLRAEAEKLGVVYAGDLAKSAADFNDNLKKLAFASEAFGVQLAGQVLPTLNELAQVMLESKDGAGSLAEVLGGAITTGLQAFSILVANVAFVLKGVGREIGAIAAQSVALATLDIDGFNAISEAVKEDGVRARAELDALERRILGLASVGAAGGGRGTAADPRALGPVGSIDEQVKAWGRAAPVIKAAGDAAKKTADEFGELYDKITGKAAGVDADFGKKMAVLEDGLRAGRVSLQEYVELVAAYIAQQPFAVAAEKAAIKLIEEEVKARVALREETLRQAAAYEQSVAGLAEENQKMREDIELIGLSEQAQVQVLQRRNQVLILTKEQELAELQLASTVTGTMSRRQIALEEEIRLLRERGSLMGVKAERENMAKVAEETLKTWEDTNKQIADSFVDNLMRGGKSVADYLKDLFRTLVLRPILQPIGNMFSGMVNSFMQQGVNGISQYLGMGSNLSTMQSGANLFSNGFSGLTAPGGSYYNFATSGVGQSMGLSNAAPIVGNNVSAYAPAGTQLSGGGGMGSLGYGAGAAATVAVIAYAAAKMWQETRGERRGGGRFDLDPATGLTSFTNGPDGDRAEGSDDIVKGIISATSTSLNDAFKSFGSTITVAALTGAYETSANSRGGVFSGGRLSNGAMFGEDGSGSNYSWTNPFDSKYEVWGMEQGRFGASGLDLNGDPAKLAVDLQQSYIAAIQAAVGLVPRIVQETFQRSSPDIENIGVDGNGAEGGELITDLSMTRWQRVFDEEMKVSARALGLLPKRILDLIIDVDPEALSAEATAELTGKISTLVTNVNGFRAIVDAMPVAQLRAATFDIAAGLVEFSGGLEQFGANITSYVDNFHTEAEKRGFVAGNISKTLGDAGINISAEELLDTTRAQFRALVEGQDLTTESGQKAYATLLSVSAAFAGIVPPADAAVDAVDEVVDTISQAMARLQADTDSLRVELLRAQGDEPGAAALQRSIDTVGLTAAEIALYDYNEGLRLQIRALNEAAAAAEEAAARQREIANERYGLETRILQLQGNTAELRARELATIDPANRALMEMIWALEDAASASATLADAARQAAEDARAAAAGARANTDAAYNALERAVAKQRESAQLAVQIAQEQVTGLQGLFGLLKGQVRELYQQVDSSAAMSAAAGRRFIGDALGAAEATGYLPDQAALSDAIGAVRQGMDGTAYKTKLDADRDRLVLAGQLAKLRDVTGDQLSTAERQLLLAKDQVKGLDDILKSARDQIDVLRGIDNSVLGVAAALQNLAAAIDAEAVATAAATAAEAAIPPATPPAAYDPLPTAPVLTATSLYTGNPLAVRSPEAANLAYWQGQIDTLGYDSAKSSFDTTVASLNAVVRGWYANHPDANKNPPPADIAWWLERMDDVGLTAAKTDFADSVAAVTGKPLLSIDAFEAGGRHKGGWRVVGERGRELEYTPPSQIFSNAQTEQMLSGGMGGEAVVAALARLEARLAAIEGHSGATASAGKNTSEVLTRVSRGGVSIYTTSA